MSYSCPKCNTDLKPGEFVCPKCGAILSSDFKEEYKKFDKQLLYVIVISILFITIIAILSFIFI